VGELKQQAAMNRAARFLYMVFLDMAPESRKEKGRRGATSCTGLYSCGRGASDGRGPSVQLHLARTHSFSP
jgi:hypothetical protein